MKTKMAGEIMIPLDKYPHIPYWFSVREAIAVIHHAELKIHGRKSLARAVLVFDEEYRLLGLVRRRDIIRGLDTEHLIGTHAYYKNKLFDMPLDPNLLEVSHEGMISKIRDKSEIPVSEIMKPIVQTLDYEDHLIKIMYEMDDTQTTLLPVLKDGIVVGVVRTVEVLHEIALMLDIE